MVVGVKELILNERRDYLAGLVFVVMASVVVKDGRRSSAALGALAKLARTA